MDPHAFSNMFEMHNSRFLLICTDGLTNMIEDAEIRHIIMKHEETPQEAVQMLVKKANEYGGKDNISVIIVSMKQE